MNDDEKEFFRRNNFSSKSFLLRIYFSDIEKRSLNNLRIYAGVRSLNYPISSAVSASRTHFSCS